MMVAWIVFRGNETDFVVLKPLIAPTNQRFSETTDICYVWHEFQP